MADGWDDELPWLGQYILDENGDAVPARGLLEWGQWMQEHDHERSLARDEIGLATVSTVFLGLDHGAHLFLRKDSDLANYKPVLWETMVFGGQYDMFQSRYSSKESALAGHGKIVQMLTS